MRTTVALDDELMRVARPAWKNIPRRKRWRTGGHSPAHGPAGRRRYGALLASLPYRIYCIDLPSLGDLLVQIPWVSSSPVFVTKSTSAQPKNLEVFNLRRTA